MNSGVITMETENWTEHARRIMKIVGLLRSRPSGLGEIAKHIGQFRFMTYQCLMEMKEKGWALKTIQDPKNCYRVLWKLYGSGSAHRREGT